MAPRVQIKKLRPDAVVPRYMTAGAAGLDLCAAIDAPVTIAPAGRAAISTGLAFAIPEGFEGQVRPRSGLARDHGITCINAPGTVDADYRGPVTVLLVNHGPEPVTIEPGHRIAQLVIAPVIQAELVETDKLSETARGTGGFRIDGTLIVESTLEDADREIAGRWSQRRFGRAADSAPRREPDRARARGGCGRRGPDQHLRLGQVPPDARDDNPAARRAGLRTRTGDPDQGPVDEDAGAGVVWRDPAPERRPSGEAGQAAGDLGGRVAIPRSPAAARIPRAAA